jgi:hypothetical protein
MIAYKFLREGAVAPFSRTAWPVPAGGDPGAWVRAAGALELCGNGIHACRPEDLPLWLFDELWEVELEPPVRVAPTHVVAAAGRLRTRVEGWGTETAAELATACAKRVARRADAVSRESGPGPLAERAAAYAADAATWGADLAAKPEIASADAACVAFIAAEAARDLEGEHAAAAERGWQAEWLAVRLGLPAG